MDFQLKMQSNKDRQNDAGKSLGQFSTKLTIAEQGQTEDDYEFILRTSETSIKYFFSLMNKNINILDEKSPPESLKNMPIVCSYADMEFKLSKSVQQEWVRMMSQDQLNLGYTFTSRRAKQLIIERTKRNVYENCRQEWMVLVNTMLSLYHVVVTELTKKQDKVLIFTPTYYRFLYTLNLEDRKVVQCKLKTRRNHQGLKEFYIDFEYLEKLFQTNDIRLVVFVNPHNPTGKAWKQQDLSRLKDLVLKYNSLVFSDDIFCECVENKPTDYCSLLKFEEIHSNLIWASSFGKAFNCSSSSFAYGMVPNPQIKKIIDGAINKMALFPSNPSTKLLESCFTVGQEWRVKTIQYIMRNHSILVEELRKRQMEIDVYALDSGFVAVIDFSAFKWPYSEIKTRLQSQNIFPTYLDNCYHQIQIESLSTVRVNLAFNRTVLIQFIDRLQKVIKN